MTRGPRYTDSKDFDEIHDEITTWVMKNYSALNVKLIEKENGARHDILYNGYPIFRGKIEVLSEEIKVEEQFDEFYPDIKIRGTIGIHHDGNLILKVNHNHPTEHIFSLKCPVCEHEAWPTTIRDADYARHFNDNNIRSDQDYLDALVRLLGWADTKLEEKEGKTISNMTWKEDYYCFEFDFLNIIEVKSHIKSFGEVIRQLQSYRVVLERWKSKAGHNYLLKELGIGGFGQVALITPDTRFNEYFEKQGFTVFTYKHESEEKTLDLFDTDLKQIGEQDKTGESQDTKDKGGANND